MKLQKVKLLLYPRPVFFILTSSLSPIDPSVSKLFTYLLSLYPAPPILVQILSYLRAGLCLPADHMLTCVCPVNQHLNGMNESK